MFSIATVGAIPDTAVASSPLTRAENRVLEAIDEHALVEELVRMIHVPSITGSDAESDLQHWHAAQLAALGFDVDTWKLKLGDLAAHPDYPGTEAPRVEGYGVVGVLGTPRSASPDPASTRRCGPYRRPRPVGEPRPLERRDPTQLRARSRRV